MGRLGGTCSEKLQIDDSWLLVTGWKWNTLNGIFLDHEHKCWYASFRECNLINRLRDWFQRNVATAPVYCCLQSWVLWQDRNLDHFPLPLPLCLPLLPRRNGPFPRLHLKVKLWPKFWFQVFKQKVISILLESTRKVPTEKQTGIKGLQYGAYNTREIQSTLWYFPVDTFS